MTSGIIGVTSGWNSGRISRDGASGVSPWHLKEGGAAGTGRVPRGGLGLGLSIVRSLVELHGGIVEARSAGAAQGTTVVFRLPLAEGRPAGLAQRAERRAYC